MRFKIWIFMIFLVKQSYILCEQTKTFSLGWIHPTSLHKHFKLLL